MPKHTKNYSEHNFRRPIGIRYGMELELGGGGGGGEGGGGNVTRLLHCN